VGFAIFTRTDPVLKSAFLGWGHHDGSLAVAEVLGMGAFENDDEIKREVDRFYDIAKECLVAVWWPAVARVAKALLKEEALDRNAFDAVLGNADVFSPVFAIQQAHGLLLRRDKNQSAALRGSGPT
jgi:hypothetical protein